MNFLVKLYRYIDGVLVVISTYFEDLIEAINHAIKSACRNFKVYDHNGDLCHSGYSNCEDQYA